MKRLFVVTAAVLLLAASCGSAAPRYSITKICSLGHGSYAQYINNSGDVAGYYSNGYGSHGFATIDGVSYDLWGFDSDSEVFGINDSGEVLGHKWIDGESHIMLWKDGQATDLGAQPYGGRPVAINNSGQILAFNGGGYVLNSSGSTPVNVPDQMMRSVDDISDSGTVVGTYGSGDPMGFLWQDGQFTYLQGIGNGYLNIEAMSDQGHIVGRLDTHPFVWHNNQLTYVCADAQYNDALGVNNHGVVVGDQNGKAFVWADGVLNYLDDLIPDEDDYMWGLKSAYAINDAGQIVGYGIYESEWSAFLMTPVPEPSSLFVLLGGCGACVPVLRRRKR